MRRVSFDHQAFFDFQEWATVDKKIHKKIVELIKATVRDPYDGIGKPEPLRADLSGAWSRKIDEKNRLVYRVTDSEILIESCKYHYSDR
ncbi:MAG: Txe/YoeB family addiction module toxin [bacterium]